MTRSMMIHHNLETTPLRIKTSSGAWSWKYVGVHLYTAEGAWIGSVYISLRTPPLYKLGFCMLHYTHLPLTLPSDINKLWIITKLPGPKITVQCNGVTVVDILLSDDTCTDSRWSTYWKEVHQIMFLSSDSASDEYWGTLPGN